MADEPVLLTYDGAVATITLNRPEHLNAFDDGLRAGLERALSTVAREASVRAVVLTGAGRGFSTGGDIHKMIEMKQSHHSLSFRGFVEAGHGIVRKIRGMPKPVLASVNGPAAGAGMSLALACDLRVASDQATFNQGFLRVGLHPDWGATFFLPSLAGTGRAMQMYLLGEAVTAEEAARLGMVNFVVPHDQLAEETRKLAARLAAAAPIPVGLLKQALYERLETRLELMMDYEVEAQMKCFNSEDATEGLKAFLEKRKPEFRGN